MKMNLISRRVRSIEELWAMDDQLSVVSGSTPSAFAAHHGLKLSKPYVMFTRTQKTNRNGARKVAQPRRNVVAA